MPGATPAHAGHVAAAGAQHDAHTAHAVASHQTHGAAHEPAESIHVAPGAVQAHPPSERGNPLVESQAMTPTSRLDDPGNGMGMDGRVALSYSMLRSLAPDEDGREPGRTLEMHLTGHMEKFAWSFDGVKHAQSGPIRLKYGERMRIVLVNDTMMSHPIHLHGMWSDVEDDAGNYLVRKHTVDMPPGSRRSYRVRADALGRWAYHCHLLYHMESGMMRDVEVRE
jgi:CopA family copper-resistance protein